jgi:repressor LexA
MYSMSELSPRRAAILTFIRDRVMTQGQAPTLAEIAEAFGFASRSVARKHVLALAEAGLIELTANQARGIRPAGLRQRADLLRVPVLGRVAAGRPIGADAGLADQLTLDRRLFSRAPDYLLRVQGDSMIEDGILDGDLVGVHRTVEARNGQIVVARLDGELTIKRFESGQEYIRLLPRNPAYAPIVVQPDQDFAIEGIYCGLVRSG